MHPSRQRGSALLLSVIVIMVAAVIGVAMMRFGAREVAGATAAQRQQALSACAELGRQVLLSRFRAVGAAPTSLPALSEPVDASTGVTILGGHYDSTDIQLDQVSLLPDAAFGVDRGAVQTLTNRIFLSGGGSKPTKAVVRCKMGGDASAGSGRQLEIEFGLRFGI
jgi:type II secretory pathway pseudopilin PulG